MNWPKAAIYWTEGDTLMVSIPFTWEMPVVREYLTPLLSMAYSRVIVGGPAVRLMPDYFEDMPHVTASLDDHPGVLQRANPHATRTTHGCPRKCGFCGVKTIEPEWIELNDWPDKPILADNNLLAASWEHLERVVERLAVWGWADFTQGLDCRLLTADHARLLARIKKPMCRLALDSMSEADAWGKAFSFLRAAGIAKSRIRSYAIVGFGDTPDEAWERCKWVESHGVKVLPMWFHPLDAMTRNTVTPEQEAMGWNDYERRRIMQWFYQHKEATC
ncbi:hypothetical protein [Oceanidesulfovibrio marinus]|uniref:Radical SAM protein n=1 Tax=Oceanidesulfovibrio marinus TaxID=370038 RepID=A0A6P1ZJY7_9BACT|nr:hypothetical protein [Oceanidesulfovibrio marinus]TVM35630.1 hypothetical protein DQK91_02900 [Oceanidesulfovibrio marinus]